MSGRIAILVMEDFQILDLSGPAAVIEISSRKRGRVETIEIIAGRSGLIRSSSGIEVLAGNLGDPGDVDTLIVTCGSDLSANAFDPHVLEFIRACSASARRVASICTGAFVLAAAGVLDGLVATTHWENAYELANNYPNVTVRADHIFVRSGQVWTSAGVTAGIDLALALVTEDYGEELARATAQALVVPLRRLGGQSQFSGLIEMQRPEARFSELLYEVRADLAGNHSVANMAARSAMSARNFARAFQAETGVTPAKAVERIRCESARAVLYAGASVKEAARSCGFADIEQMRRAFRRTFAAAPAAFKFMPSRQLSISS